MSLRLGLLQANAMPQPLCQIADLPLPTPPLVGVPAPSGKIDLGCEPARLFSHLVTRSPRNLRLVAQVFEHRCHQDLAYTISRMASRPSMGSWAEPSDAVTRVSVNAALLESSVDCQLRVCSSTCCSAAGE